MLALVILIGLLGAIAHWFNNYAKGKTENGFVAYLKSNSTNTISTFISILVSSLTLYQTNPPTFSISLLITTFLAGYSLDSVINKDNTPTIKDIKKELKKIEDIKHEDENKNISDLIADDNRI